MQKDICIQEKSLKIRKNKKAFTLVELIIVISILSILSTIGYMSLGEYTKTARDANRMTQIKTIYEGLRLQAMKTVTYPKPEGHVEIKGLSFQGYVGESTIKKINMGKLPKDPKDETQYLYSINNKKRKAQLGIYLEAKNDKLFGSYVVPETYANNIDYTQRYLYTIGEKVGIFLTPEKTPIQQTYTGVLDLTTHTGTFSVQLDNSSSSGVITGSGQDLLTNITIIQTACILDNTVIHNGDQIWAYETSSIPYPQTCVGIQRKCSNGILSGNEDYKYASCTAGTPLNCTPTTQSGYTIPNINHNQTQNVTKTVSNGTADMNASCINGVLSYGNENISCNSTYILQGGTCVPDTCPGIPPSYSVVNGTQSISGTWSHNITPGVCTYVCQVGYYYQGGNCVPASIGYYVPSQGQTTQTACSANTNYQNVTGQSSCKTVSTGYYSTPIGAVPHTGQTLCEANNYCVNGVKTACPVGTSSPTGSSSAGACITNTYTVSGSFGANANGATINVCGTNVTAAADGSFSTTRNHGAVCNTITATRTGYTCSTTTNGPASLTANFTTVAGSCVSNALQNTWTATTTTGAPIARYGNTAVWTGNEMIVWGGMDSSYNLLNTGGRYNPTTNTWTAITTTGAPVVRTGHSAVWAGNEMIIWGGNQYLDPGVYLNTGGRYNPTTNTWTATTTTGAPLARYGHTAVWTGNEMIIWGGSQGNLMSGMINYNTGGKYNPTTNTWTVTTTTGAPSVRMWYTAVWTGTELIVWGGIGDSSVLNTGGRYNPTTNTWTATSTSGVIARYYHTAIWTGTEMIVWGGGDSSYNGVNTGGRYNPVNNSWTAMTNTSSPSIRMEHTAIWTGTEMIIWGGGSGSAVNTGGRYNPVNNSWTTMTTTGAPTARNGHSAVWTGTEMIIWGGGSGGVVNTGGIYK